MNFRQNSYFLIISKLTLEGSIQLWPEVSDISAQPAGTKFAYLLSALQAYI